MSKNLNKVQLTGNLGKDPETRSTPQGSALTRFSVASSRSWRTAEGEDRADTEWFNVVAWNKLGELCAQYLQKGSRVYIEGRLQTRSWEDQQTGQKRYMVEVIANDMIMLDARRERRVDASAEDVGTAGFHAPEAEQDAAPPADQERDPQGQSVPARFADTGADRSFGSGGPARPVQRRAAAEAPATSTPYRPVASPATDVDDVPFERRDRRTPPAMPAQDDDDLPF